VTEPMLTYALFAAGVLILIGGASVLVDGAAPVVWRLSMPDIPIGLTVVAIGTSTPELFVNLLAAYRGTTDLAIGNIVGSNILNVFLILGIGAVIFPLPFRPDMNLDILVMIGASLFVFLFMFTGGRSILDRWEGAALLACYLAYVGYLALSSGVSGSIDRLSTG